MVYGSTREQILHLLRRGSQTVEELATATRLTPNAVRAQLTTLGRDELVEQVGLRRGFRRPAAVYRLTGNALDELSNAHRPFLAALIRELARNHPPEDVRRLLLAAGRSLAPNLPAHASREQRLEAAVDALRGLGADVEIETSDGGILLRGYTCPLRDAVAECREVCGALAGLVEAVLGARVEARCTEGDRPACRFHVPDDGAGTVV